MPRTHPLAFLLLLLAAFALSTAQCSQGSGANLLVSALVGRDGESAFECWAVQPPFAISQQAGTVGAKIQSLGDLAGASIVFFNASGPTDAGLHNAPAPQWVVLVRGSGVVTLPTTGAQLPLPEGALIIANDTAAVSRQGHNTRYIAGTAAAQFPFAGGVIPNHTVVNPDGPCSC